jgi:hypothetical protein
LLRRLPEGVQGKSKAKRSTASRWWLLLPMMLPGSKVIVAGVESAGMSASYVR